MKRYISLLLALVLLCGCANQTTQTSSEKERTTIAVLLKAMDNPHWQEMRSGMLDAAANHDTDVILLYPEDETSTRQQTMIFNDMLERHPDAIVWSPCDSSLGPQMKELADQAGVPLFTVDTRATGVQLPYIGVDNRLLGQTAAKYMAESAGYHGQFAVIAGSEKQSCHVERAEGFRDAMSNYPNVEVVAVRYAVNRYGFDAAMHVAEELLDSYPELDGLFCTSGVMGLGAAEQVKASYRQGQVSVVTQDTQSDILSAVSNGLIRGMMTQDGYDMGYLAIETVLKSLSGQKTDQNIYLPTRLITWGNVDEFMNEYLQRRDSHD